MKNLEEKDLYHGMPVTCEIDGVKITDAKIAIDKDGDFYIVHNHPQFASCTYYGSKLGYSTETFLFLKNGDGKNRALDITNLRPAIRKIEDGLVEGDVIVEGNFESTVLGICGRAIFISIANDFNVCSSMGTTLEELIAEGYKLKQPKPIEEVEDITVAEVCRRLGKTVRIVE